jgi:hypothetical protein
MNKTPLPDSYLAGLTPSQRLLQQRAIQRSRKTYEKTGKVSDRPKVSDNPTPRSRHAKKFEEKFGFSVSDIPRVKKEFPSVDVDGILAKGRAAYASSGSRPNTTAEAWARARLASALTGGKAANVDKNLL